MTNLGSLFTTFNYGHFFTNISLLGLTATDWIVVGVASALLWIYDVYKARLNPVFEHWAAWGKLTVIFSLALIVLVFGRYGLGFNAAGFVYGGY